MIYFFVLLGNALHGTYLTRFFATVLSIKNGESVDYEGDPFSYVFFPIYNSFDPANRTAVAVLFTAINWAVFFEDVFPETIVGISFVLDNTCDKQHSYTINGKDVIYEGEGDLHDPKYDHMKRTFSLEALEHNETDADALEAEGGLSEKVNYLTSSNGCPYSIHVYPSQAFEDSHTSATPILMTIAVAGVFVFTAFMFICFDRLVERRQQILLNKATQSTAILTSLYPKAIRDRLLRDAEEQAKAKVGKGGDFIAPNHRLKSFLTGSEKFQDHPGNMQPIADLFPHTTVMFADISGFTSWSSVRDPGQVCLRDACSLGCPMVSSNFHVRISILFRQIQSFCLQVFVLLQTVFQHFDAVAKKRRVFKVETIGDW